MLEQLLQCTYNVIDPETEEDMDEGEMNVMNGMEALMPN